MSVKSIWHDSISVYDDAESTLTLHVGTPHFTLGHKVTVLCAMSFILKNGISCGENDRFIIKRTK